jgi:hypothetical protein
MATPIYGSPELPHVSETVIGWLTEAARGPSAARVAGWDDATWDLARWAAQVHGIAPLLDHAAAGWPDAGALHPRLSEYLAQQRRRSAARVGLLLGDLVEILEAFAARGIAAMPLKGALLAPRAYPEPGLRPMNDLDLLVRPVDEKRALAALGRLGYRQLARSWKHTMLAKPAAYGPTVARDGEHPDNPRSLDLHTRLSEQFWGIRYDITAEVWDNAAPGTLLGHAAWIMAHEDLLHHLAIHATTDMIARRARVMHLYDIALAVAGVDRGGWERIADAARVRGEQRFVYPSLALASRYFAVVPPDLLAALREGVPADLLRYLDANGLDRLSFCNAAPTTPAEKLCWYRPGRERAVALRHILLPDPNEIVTWFPRLSRPALLPLAYACYGGQMLGWAARRALGRPRLKLAAPGAAEARPE